MATTSILPLTLGAAVLGRPFEPDDPPDHFRDGYGQCWRLVTDPAAVQAAQDAAQAQQTARDAFALAQYAPRIADRPPGQADGVDKPDGAGWLEYDPATQMLKQMWRWTGAAWERLPMDPVMIPVIQIGTGTAGDLTADRLIVTGDFVARVAEILQLSVENLIVSEGATINELVALSIAGATADFQEAYIQNLRTNGATIDEAIIGDLAANIITSGLFRTAESGQRIVINESGLAMYNENDVYRGSFNHNGLYMYDENDRRTIKLDGRNNFISGVLSTGREGQPAAVLTPVTSAGGGAGIWFTQDGSLGDDQAAIYSQLDGNIRIRPKDTVPTGTVFIDGNLIVDSRTDFHGIVTAEGFTTTGRAWIETLDTEGNAAVYGSIYYYGAPTTTSEPNVFVSSNGGVIARSTSSRRYKKDIVDWSPDAEAILGLRPREWTHDDPNNPPEMADDTRHVGFIAEEVHDLGLTGLVYYSDDKNGDPRPESLNYGRFSAAHQVVLKDHEARISELESENADLRQQIADLAARLDAAGI